MSGSLGPARVNDRRRRAFFTSRYWLVTVVRLVTRWQVRGVCRAGAFFSG